MRLLPLLLLSLTLSACSRTSEPNPATAITDLRGQWLVINYWAQWCKPCIEEIPELNALDHAFDQVSVLGVNFDGDSGDQLSSQIETLGLDFPVLPYDPARELGTSRPVVLPTTLIVDPSGILVQTLVGPQTFESLATTTGQQASSQNN
jgi:thiol-disulfide isomerase/thioredoxin